MVSRYSCPAPARGRRKKESRLAIKRIIIFSGGRLGEWALSYISEGDWLVGADSGARFLVANGLKPRLAIGDFDSVSSEELAQIGEVSEELISCDPVYKDFTDTEMAVEWALSQCPDELLLLGALGTRMDHSLANMHLLRKARDCGVQAVIADDHNRIALTGEGETLRISKSESNFTHVSLLPLSLEVTGITLEGFQYPLHRATLRLGQSLGISNVLNDAEGFVTTETGLLLVIQSRD
ncbi:thiamine diphosphokinase [Paenibacillus contaminans]|uniref:Thiamine diphosphokinase n=1 Tax=Paenibacillus contaminans TaxID=450362 RepID=A0A329MAX1_9BACL|nr:thiamine diphosphokinase [Paenibacillus contaminans]